jgi:hypothetical protein
MTEPSKIFGDPTPVLLAFFAIQSQVFGTFH